MIEPGKRYLVSTVSWFTGPDGQSYKAAWGVCTLQSVDQAFPGFRVTRPSTNWFMRVGSGEQHVLIAGCQIHYAVRCETRPVDNLEGITYVSKENGVTYNASQLYLAEERP